jgi:hypothetical protein
MRSLVTNVKTLVIAVIGFVGGLFWMLTSNMETEPTILVIVSFIEIIGFGVLRNFSENDPVEDFTASGMQSGVNVNVSVGNVEISSGERKFDAEVPIPGGNTVDREAKIELMKSKIKVLFIDDDRNFNVVKILKNGGWRYTKSVTDIKGVDIQVVKESDILFIDINGVGRAMCLQNEGLDLALMVKERYPNKKVIIYSANRNSNAFHDAWVKCDFRLEKNALPSQFQNLVEKYSVELYNGN